jgi:DNA-directed RNA polymerase specialized sigma24 family protein
MDDVDLGGLLGQAAGGDARAWGMLVDRLAGLVWAVARGHGLNKADAAEVSQVTWQALATSLGAVTDPGQVGLWLAAKARRESMRLLRQDGRDVSSERSGDWVTGDRGREAIDDLARPGRDAALWRAFEALDGDCKALLRVLLADPPLSDNELSEVFDLPIADIAQLRARCFDGLGDRAWCRPRRSQTRRSLVGTVEGRVP